ncbi:hypothetical protein [Tellurirhabdus rosea]|nr:hypothetical protein [Tellurirhabdus rosea]
MGSEKGLGQLLNYAPEVLQRRFQILHDVGCQHVRVGQVVQIA